MFLYSQPSTVSVRSYENNVNQINLKVCTKSSLNYDRTQIIKYSSGKLSFLKSHRDAKTCIDLEG